MVLHNTSLHKTIIAKINTNPRNKPFSLLIVLLDTRVIIDDSCDKWATTSYSWISKRCWLSGPSSPPILMSPWLIAVRSSRLPLSKASVIWRTEWLPSISHVWICKTSFPIISLSFLLALDLPGDAFLFNKYTISRSRSHSTIRWNRIDRHLDNLYLNNRMQKVLGFETCKYEKTNYRTISRSETSTSACQWSISGPVPLLRYHTPRANRPHPWRDQANGGTINWQEKEKLGPCRIRNKTISHNTLSHIAIYSNLHKSILGLTFISSSWPSREGIKPDQALIPI